MRDCIANLVKSIVNEGDRVDLRVYVNGSAHIGYLAPFTRSDLANDSLLDAMAEWRNRHKRSFLTQAEVTRDSTRRFVERAVFQDPSRLLFIVHSLTAPVGTIGLKLAPPWVHGAGPYDELHRSLKVAELANLLLGVRDGHPMLLHYGELALMEWAFDKFDIDIFWSAIPSENKLALTYARFAGFTVTGVIPLMKKEMAGVTHLVPGEEGQPSPDGLYASRIELPRSVFVARRAAGAVTKETQSSEVPKGNPSLDHQTDGLMGGNASVRSSSYD